MTAENGEEANRLLRPIRRLVALLRRAFDPPIRIAVRPIPGTRGWLVRLPLELQRASDGTALLKPAGPDSDAYVWAPAIPYTGSVRQKCRLCREEAVTEPLDLGEQCYRNLTALLLLRGILVVTSVDYLDGLIEQTSWLLRLRLRRGRPKVWITLGRQYGIVHGREAEFCDIINGILKLEGEVRLEPERLGRLVG